MLQQHQEPETGLRYDAQMQRRVVEIAARLQQEDQDRNTIHQIVEAAGEIGLEPHYVQQAFAQVQAEQQATTPVTKTTVQRSTAPTRAEYRRFMTAMTAPMALGALALTVKDVTGLAILLSMVLPIPLACLSGFLTGRKRVGFVTASLLVMTLAPTVYHLGIHDFYRTHADDLYQSWFQNGARGAGVQSACFYLMLGTPLAGLLGLFGAWTRQRYVPHPSIEPKSDQGEPTRSRRGQKWGAGYQGQIP